MRKHSLAFYFFMAYAISWILLTPSVLSAWGILQGNFSFMFALHTFGPATAAVIMIGIMEGREGLLRLRHRITQWRARGRWWLFILLGIPALVMLGIVVQPGALAGFQGLTGTLLVSYPVYYLATWLLGGPLGEEIGWRGFALPHLQPRYGPLLGTLILGVLWTCWHLYEFLMPTMGGGPGTGLATFLTNFPLFLGMVMSVAIIMTWLFNYTKGSIFAAISAHSSIDTPQATLIPLFPAVAVTGMFVSGLIGFGVAALLVVVMTRGRLGYKPLQEQPLTQMKVEVQPIVH